MEPNRVGALHTITSSRALIHAPVGTYRTLAKQRHSSRIATKVANVLLHPRHGQSLIKHTCTQSVTHIRSLQASPTKLPIDAVTHKEAQHAKTVVDGDHHGVGLVRK